MLGYKGEVLRYSGREKRMSKLKTIVIYVIIIALIFCFFAYKANKTSEKISTVSELAIEYAEKMYVGKHFEMASWNYHNHDQSYTVTVRNTENKIILLYCRVTPSRYEDNSYYVRAYGGQNINLLDEGNGTERQGEGPVVFFPATQEDSSAVPEE